MIKSTRDKEILRWLDGWREIALIARSVLLWEVPSYPFAILGAVTLLFLELSYMEPLTVVCGAALVAVVIDYALPRISQRLWQGDEWTSSKQAQLEDMSQSLASSIDFIIKAWCLLQASKNSNPGTYYLIVVPTLFVFGWIGSIVNNLFITYIIVLMMVMFPGLHHRGLVANYYNMVLETVLHFLRSFTHRSRAVQLAKKTD